MFHMSESTPGDLPDALDIHSYRHWKREHQQRALELLHERENSAWRPFYCPLASCDGKPHDEWEWEHARADQRPPKWSDPWLVMLMSGGRGAGKTRTGSEITHRVTKLAPRIGLIAPTGPDFRDTMVEGVSGILATSPPGQRPLWEPSKKRLTWPNGCIGQGFSAEEPDRLRGPQFGFVWGDEPGHWPLVEEVWANMLLGLRVGKNPKVIATSTPKPTKWMKAVIADPMTVVHRVSTYANLANLSETFQRTVLERYEGTRLGRQELHGEVLEDVEGALWGWEMFEWIAEAPTLTRIVVAVDPAGSVNPKADETGIVVLGIGEDKKIYVLADLTGRYTPAQWGDKVIEAYEDFSADSIIAEKNYGGLMVKHVLETSVEKRRALADVKLVESRRGKQIRANPIVALYEKKRVLHVGKRGDLALLEEEQTSWVPGESNSPSPNRVDALVHGATALAKQVMPAAVANPNELLRNRRTMPDRHLRAVI